jgi:hypothetical protein
LAEGAKLKTLFVYAFERFTQFKSVLLMPKTFEPRPKSFADKNFLVKIQNLIFPIPP